MPRNRSILWCTPPKDIIHRRRFHRTRVDTYCTTCSIASEAVSLGDLPVETEGGSAGISSHIKTFSFFKSAIVQGYTTKKGWKFLG